MINNLPNCHNLGEPANTEIGHAVQTASSPVETGETATLKDLEAQHISDLLDQYHGNRKKAADALGISERTIYRKLKHLGIH